MSSSTPSPDGRAMTPQQLRPLELSRRTLLRASGYAGAATLSAALFPRPVRALATHLHTDASGRDARWNGISIADPAVKSLALRAIDAAKSAGAVYADVRLTRTEYQWLSGAMPDRTTDRETFAIGVRVLVNGYWGFASSPFWTGEDAVRLARAATAQATFNARGPAQTVDLGTIPVASGSWTMPVQIDPFTVPFDERLDFLKSWYDLASRYHHRVLFMDASAEFARQRRAVATSDGAYFTQTLYESAAECNFDVKHPDWHNERRYRVQAEGMDWAGKGWELLLDADPHAQVPRMFEEAEELLRAPEKPVEIGRYDIVFPASIVASLVDRTIGMPTELDRAMGFEANASGTSYLNQPLKMLGSYNVGNPLITVTGNRSAPGGLATVKWDDEGVAPTEMTLVRDGVVTDFQTTREQAAWLAPWYQKQQRAAQSHGCAGSATALDVTLQRPPNLALSPGQTSAGLNDLIADVKRGILVCISDINTDYQGRTGSGGGFPLILREIVNGKPGAVVLGGNFLFNTSQLWNDVIALGGPSSAREYGALRTKGQPEQKIRHSVRAVPMVVKEVAMFDSMRKV